ncbi:MAG: peptidylprolyl isomerase [Pirellulaceae bacterium]
MQCKDACGSSPRTNLWKKRLVWLTGSVAVIAAFVIGRYLFGTDAASAQAPSGRPAPAAGATPSPRTANVPTRPTVRSVTDSQPAAASPAGPVQPDTQNKVAAVVNGEAISRQELANECLRRYGVEVLESIVNKHLIWQACQARNIVITEQDVNDEVTRAAAKFGLSVDRWLSLLEDERDVTPDKYRRDIIWPTLALRRLAADRLVVTDEEFNRAFEAEYGPKVRVRLIAVSTHEKAEQIRQQALAKPASFGDLAKDYSEDQTSAPIRGLIPPIRRHQGYPELENAAFALKKGEVSPIIQVANQHLILYCEEQLPETAIAPQHLEATKQRIRDRVRDDKLRTAASDLFQKLQTEAQIVNVFNDAELQKQHPGVAAIINGRQITIRDLSEECITRYGETVIDGEINRKLLLQAMKRKNTTVAEQDLDHEIARAADSFGYIKTDGSPDVETWLKAVTEADGATVELYVRDAVWPTVALKKLVGDRIEVTQEDLTKGFQANYGERVEVMAIVLDNQRQANKVWEMARANPTEDYFGRLAEQYSIEPVSQANQGRIPPIRQHGGQPLIENEAFRLKPGELSGIIAVEDKYIMTRCLGRTTPEVAKLDDVKDELLRDIHEKKLRIEMASEFDRLKESAQIDNFIAGTSQSGKAISRPSGAAQRPLIPTATSVRPVATPVR